MSKLRQRPVPPADDDPPFLDESSQDALISSFREEHTRQTRLLSTLLLSLTLLSLSASAIKTLSSHSHNPFLFIVSLIGLLSCVWRSWRLRPASKALEWEDETVRWGIRIVGGICGIVVGSVGEGWGRWLPGLVWLAVGWGEWETVNGEQEVDKLEGMKYELKGA